MARMINGKLVSEKKYKEMKKNDNKINTAIGVARKNGQLFSTNNIQDGQEWSSYDFGNGYHATSHTVQPQINVSISNVNGKFLHGAHRTAVREFESSDLFTINTGKKKYFVNINKDGKQIERIEGINAEKKAVKKYGKK